MEDIKVIEDAYNKCSCEESAEVMAELLMDDQVSSWKMFEELVSAYQNGTAEKRSGIDAACAILTGNRLASIAEIILSRAEAA